jgi:soluble lytic murein transglycosylase-like protein
MSTNVAQLASNAGFTGSDLVTATAIALAESGGNPTAYNPETAAGTASGEGSYGLWQIYETAHPEYSASDLLDPQSNADAAFDIYSGSGGTFSAWSTYTSGAYQSFLSEAQSMVDALGLGSGDDSSSSWIPTTNELLVMAGVAAVTLFVLMR